MLKDNNLKKRKNSTLNMICKWAGFNIIGQESKYIQY